MLNRNDNLSIAPIKDFEALENTEANKAVNRELYDSIDYLSVITGILLATRFHLSHEL